jgi:ABC-type multidrug transport system fused ATPase/permease subunit
VTTANGYGDLALFSRLLRLARPYWPHIGILFLLGLLLAPLAVLTSLPLKIAVDSAVGSRPLPDFLDALLPDAATRSKGTVLILAVGLAMAVALLTGLLELVRSVLSAYTGKS